MARLFDEIKSSDESKLLKNAVCFEVSNVSDYFHLVSTGGKEWKMNNNIPNVLPPFPQCFLEYNFPKGTHDYIRKAGVLILTYLVEDAPAGWNDDWIKKTSLATKPPKWFSRAVLFTDCINGDLFDFGMLNYAIAADGSWLTTTQGLILSFERFEHSDYKIETNKLIEIVFNEMFPAFLAISFLHCKKQTKVIEHETPLKVQKKREKNNKLPLTKYYTLDIEPLKEILRTEGRIHEVGLQKALHICRGHFKDYSQGAGLFGKYKGLYWYDAQIRGNEKNGTIIKDYAIKLPGGEESVND